jgi:hypothetical protein
LTRTFKWHMGCFNHRSFDPCFLGMIGSQIAKLIFNAITILAIIRNSIFQIENVSSFFIFLFQYLSNGIKRSQFKQCRCLHICPKDSKHMHNFNFQSKNSFGSVKIQFLKFLYILWECVSIPR